MSVAALIADLERYDAVLEALQVERDRMAGELEIAAMSAWRAAGREPNGARCCAAADFEFAELEPDGRVRFNSVCSWHGLDGAGLTLTRATLELHHAAV